MEDKNFIITCDASRMAQGVFNAHLFAGKSREEAMDIAFSAYRAHLSQHGVPFDEDEDQLVLSVPQRWHVSGGKVTKVTNLG